MKNSSRLRYPNGLVLRLRLTPHFMGCFSPVLSEITFRVSSASGDSPYSQIKSQRYLRKFLTTRKYTVSLTSSIELPQTPLFSRTSISFSEKEKLKCIPEISCLSFP